MGFWDFIWSKRREIAAGVVYVSLIGALVAGAVLLAGPVAPWLMLAGGFASVYFAGEISKQVYNVVGHVFPDQPQAQQVQQPQAQQPQAQQPQAQQPQAQLQPIPVLAEAMDGLRARNAINVQQNLEQVNAAQRLAALQNQADPAQQMRRQ